MLILQYKNGGRIPFSQQSYIVNPDSIGEGSSSVFGWAMDVNDSYLVVGAPGFYAGNESIAYIFNPDTGALLHTLTNPNTTGISADDYFGYSVSLNSTHVAIGAPGEEDTLVPGNKNSGKVYIFELSSGNLVETYNNPNSASSSSDDDFGHSVAMNETHLYVGAPKDDGSGFVTNSGASYIFDLATTNLLHTKKKTSGALSNEGYGTAVAINTKLAMVGIPNWDGNSMGAAQGWVATSGALGFSSGNPNLDGGGINDRYGEAVAASETRILISAPAADVGGDTNTGIVYVYNQNAGYQFRLDNPNAYGTQVGDSFGESLAASDYHMVVGAPNEDDAGGTSAGAAYVYDTGGTLLHSFNAPNIGGASQDDEFGKAVAACNKYIVISAPYDSEGANSGGIVFVYNTGL